MNGEMINRYAALRFAESRDRLCQKVLATMTIVAENSRYDGEPNIM